jgi:hypothetical protein
MTNGGNHGTAHKPTKKKATGKVKSEQELKASLKRKGWLPVGSEKQMAIK